MQTRERHCTKLIEHFRRTSKCEPGNRYRSAASLALPRGSWALKSLLCCHLELDSTFVLNLNQIYSLLRNRCGVTKKEIVKKMDR